MSTSRGRVLLNSGRTNDQSSVAGAATLIHAMRRSAGLSQFQLAKKIKTSQSEISRIEAGATKRGVTAAMLAKIATACDLKLFLSFCPDKDK